MDGKNVDETTKQEGFINAAYLCDENDTSANGKIRKDVVKQTVSAKKKIGIVNLFRYAEFRDVFLCTIGSLFSVFSAVAVAYNLVVYGNVINVFISTASNDTSHINGSYNNNIIDEIAPYAYTFTILGFVSMVTGYVSVTFWSWTAERQIKRMRTDYFRAVVTQEMTWFDTQNTRELTSRLTHDVPAVSEAIGHKMALFVQWLATWVTSTIVSFCLDWRLALVTMSFSPIIVLISVMLSRWVKLYASKESEALAEAEGITTESLRAIRTVQAFQGQEKEAGRYAASLKNVKRLACKKGLALGLSMSAFWFNMFAAFAVTFWYGMNLVQRDDIKPGQIVTIFISLIIANMSLSYAFPFLGTLANAKGAARRVFDVVDSVPVIDSSPTAGQVTRDIKGNIEFNNVWFNYPSRPEVQVLKGLNLRIPAGKTVAVVGRSGCGKSTVLQLLLRLYDPTVGEIYMNGVDLKDLSVGSVRRQVGVVGQEPVLFGCTVEDNIRYGCEGASLDDIEQAAREANAHDFISQLPQGYNTMLGEGGAQLSGGQKQRIAIARALVRNPTLLLLDEATSALDRESERVVQNALEKASSGRTTVVVTHRLSTIETSDLIIALSEGRIVESGTHRELMERGRLYPQLVKLQNHIIPKKDEDINNMETAEFADSHREDETPDLGAEEENHRNTGKLKTRSIRQPERTPLSVNCANHTYPQTNGDQTPRIPDVSPGGKRCTRNQELGEKSEPAKKGTDGKSDGLIRILKMNRSQWICVVIGCFSSVISGCIQPAFAFILTDFIRVFGMQHEPEKQASTSLILCITIVVGGVVAAILKLTQTASFVWSSATLTNTIKLKTFVSMLHQDMEFFDDPHNQVGYLTTGLSRDSQTVNGVCGVQIGNVLETVATVVFSLVMAFTFGWKLTLVVLTFVPIIITTEIIKGKVTQGSAKTAKSSVENSGKMVAETVDSIRTVAMLSLEQTMLKKYGHLVNNICRRAVRQGHLNGVSYGVAQAVIYFSYAATFTYGAYLVSRQEMEFFEVFRVFSAITFGGQQIGRTLSSTPHFKTANMAASRLYSVIDREPRIDTRSEEGKTPVNFSGRLQIDNASFRYPSRPAVAVLRDCSLRIESGQTLALVGPSGCGKSTVLQLLQRFYDPHEGQVLADSYDLQFVDVSWWRYQIAVVSQEPDLFDCTIAENIAYGDNRRHVTMDDIIGAAREANIHSFITALPQGYETRVGDKGLQISGGQKQRIAIARALVRKPKILLFDEATSALDTESEKVVQEAMDKARQGRTSIIVTHRLSSVRHAHAIAVMHGGAVQEVGSHEQLVTLKGAYYRLLHASNTNERNNTENNNIDT